MQSLPVLSDNRLEEQKAHVAPCKNLLWLSHTSVKSMCNPLLPETMETDTVLAVWQITSSSSATPFTRQEQRLCTHVDQQHTLGPHRSTQCSTFSSNPPVIWCGEGLSALCHSRSLSALCILTPNDKGRHFMNRQPTCCFCLRGRAENNGS